MGAAVGRIPEISALGQFIFIGMLASVAAYDIAISVIASESTWQRRWELFLGIVI